MELSKRPPIYELPSYSLTADLLGFLRCGLQYRYTRIGRLTPSRPVQMWFGQFIHGVLEEAFRRYATARDAGRDESPPWREETLEEIRDLVKGRLAAQGLHAWDEDLERLGDLRADAAVNELGMYLFPLIHRAEVRLTGSRVLPPIETALQFREADRYEIVGVVDVISHVELQDPQLQDNLLVRLLTEELDGNLPERFELIIDYKGMRRPPIRGGGARPTLWEVYGWQLQTYAHLRRAQDDHLPIAAGLLLYLNELVPTTKDIVSLRKEITNDETDVKPSASSEAAEQLNNWRVVGDPLPLDYRLKRAIRVVPVDDATIQQALTEFDDVVVRIETCRGREIRAGNIVASWDRNNTDDDTCVACDSRTFCPSYPTVTTPRLPTS
ncbi:MAG: PD-(D/E)XK nuclease family protein [Actinomycetota bacterium]